MKLVDNLQVANLISPLFHLSLTSKELFHSNFLSCFFENYKQEGIQILRPLIGDTRGEYSIAIKREEKNRDVVIYFADNAGHKKKLTIENKVKSLPALEQLQRYSEDAMPHDYFVLLSLSRPYFLDGEVIHVSDQVKWVYLSYDRSQ